MKEKKADQDFAFESESDYSDEESSLDHNGTIETQVEE